MANANVHEDNCRFTSSLMALVFVIGLSLGIFEAAKSHPKVTRIQRVSSVATG